MQCDILLTTVPEKGKVGQRLTVYNALNRLKFGPSYFRGDTLIVG